jgi:hypothetical protein
MVTTILHGAVLGLLQLLLINAGYSQILAAMQIVLVVWRRVHDEMNAKV